MRTAFRTILLPLVMLAFLAACGKTLIAAELGDRARQTAGNASPSMAVRSISPVIDDSSVPDKYSTGSVRDSDAPAVVLDEPRFTATVLVDGLESPWEMLWGPDGWLWVTERKGKRIVRIHPDTGEIKKLVDIPEAYPGPQHEGVLGMAFSPRFTTGEPHVFVYYTCKDGDRRCARLVRYNYNDLSGELFDQQVVLDKIPAGADHNGGRVRFGPDGMLYLSLGEQGHNQGDSYCLPIEAQRIPRMDEVAEQNWDAYRGKVLRLRPDGGIPEDNPEIQGVRSHVFTYGHRNPQGLVWVDNQLFSCEHGPSSDDEINLLTAGGNYGWPHVAGFRDGQGYKYANYSAAPNCHELQFDPDVIPDGVPIQYEMEWFASDFIPPVKTFWTVRNDHNFHDAACGDSTYICYPTIAPSSITYYPPDGPIAAWRNCLLVTTLKTGSVFSVRLSGDRKQVQGDVGRFLRSRNRYRVMAFDPDLSRVFIATDPSGGAMDETGKPAGTVRNPGSILVFTLNPR